MYNPVRSVLTIAASLLVLAGLPLGAASAAGPSAAVAKVRGHSRRLAPRPPVVPYQYIAKA